MRDDDIPAYIRDGIADIGIVGRNEYDEQAIDLEVLRDLGFAKCRLSIAVPNDFVYKGLSSLEGKRVATSYPNILGGILKKEWGFSKLCPGFRFCGDNSCCWGCRCHL